MASISSSGDRIRILDVAQRAGVSPATVSRVLNDYAFVKPATRESVLRAMEELRYRPNALAQGMRTGRSRVIGLLVSDISNPLFATIGHAIERTVAEAGFSMVLVNSDNDAELETAAVQALTQSRIDGLIAAIAGEPTPAFRQLLEELGSVVLLEREMPGLHADSVTSDHELGIGRAVDHLARLGHRRIGLTVGPERHAPSRARRRAFLKALEAAGLDADLARVIQGSDLSREAGYRAACELLGAPEHTDAVIAGSNQLLIGLLEACRDLSLEIPADVSVVGADDTDIARLHKPPIDIVARDVPQLGRTAASLLLARMANPELPPRDVTLETWFEVRGSTAARP